MMTRVVFAGPSLFPFGSASWPGIELRPPASRGDIIRACHDNARVVGLIDGVFEQQPSVWHKEILYAVDRGVAVIGGASMGALRAVECVSFGMVGVGEIFAEYMSGDRMSDADVAVLHAPAALQYQPITVSLVDVQATVDNLRAHGVTSRIEHNELLETARHTQFKERTWSRVFAEANFSVQRIRELTKSMSTLTVDKKQQDAVQVMQAVLAYSEHGSSHTRMTNVFNLQTTGFLEGLLQNIRAENAA